MDQLKFLKELEQEAKIHLLIEIQLNQILTGVIIQINKLIHSIYQTFKNNKRKRIFKGHILISSIEIPNSLP